VNQASHRATEGTEPLGDLRAFARESSPAPTLCLSIRQPWAWLIVNGWKNIENREWPTRQRGPIYVHASQTMTRGDYESCRIFVEGIHADLWSKIPPANKLERGGIVGQTTILSCVTQHPSEWFCGRFGFVLDDSKPLPFVACPGQLRFFPAPEECQSVEYAASHRGTESTEPLGDLRAFARASFHICHTKGVNYCMHRTKNGVCTRKTKMELCDWVETKLNMDVVQTRLAGLRRAWNCRLA
jgi:hypothetical protein